MPEVSIGELYSSCCCLRQSFSGGRDDYDDDDASRVSLDYTVYPLGLLDDCSLIAILFSSDCKKLGMMFLYFFFNLYNEKKKRINELLLRKENCMFVSGFAIVYILVTVPFMLPWGARGALTGFLSWCHLIGAVSPWIGSFLYHVFMNLDYGEAVYRCLLKLDMLGIWICQSIGNVYVYIHAFL